MLRIKGYNQDQIIVNIRTTREAKMVVMTIVET